MKLTFLVPIKATSSLNARLHWATRARKVKAERQATALAAKVNAGAWMPGYLNAVCAHGARITLTRIGPRRLDDDNVQGCLKAVRDEVANQLGIDDGDARLTWVYAQERGPYGVRVEIETREAEAA